MTKFTFHLIASGLLLSAFSLALTSNEEDRPQVKQQPLRLGTKTIVSKLNVPWEIAWGPDNWIWFTEQSGTVSKVDPQTGKKRVLLRIPKVYRFRSLGLLGMTIHPDKNMPYVFLDYTYRDENTSERNGIPKDGKKIKEGKAAIFSALVRYTYHADTLLDPVVLLKDIPGATGHNGSRVVIAPDGKLMLSTGDATTGSNAQDIKSINGKVLRLNIDGSIPDDNPIAGSPVWSLGHRNIQGLTYGANGILYSSEHGDAIEDELNIIRKSGNYGWPNVEGFCNTPEEKTFCNANKVREPLKAWTPVIAPAGISYYNSPAIPEWKNSILLVTLKTQSLWVLKLNDAGDQVLSETLHLDQEMGRLRDLCVSPAGDVYVATSNRDWNPAEGYPKAEDDRIVRVFKMEGPTMASSVKRTAAAATIKKPVAIKKSSNTAKPVLPAGALVYKNYCESCHKSTGVGLPGVFPPLKGTTQVTGDKNALIRILLRGMSGPVTIKGVKYDQQMPAFNFLSDKDISAVATYIRTQFGNKGSAVGIAEVSKIRAAK